MSAIGPGDWVECVDMRSPGRVGFRWLRGERVPQEGSVYRVSDLWTDSNGEVVILVGWERVGASLEHGRRVGFRANRFRPIYRPKADLIESLKTPAKREGVPA